jgi:uncharacterized protein (TIGR03437 family)
MKAGPPMHKLLLPTLLFVLGLPAQIVDSRWSPLVRLSDPLSNVVDRDLVSDRGGHSYSFWIEHIAADGRYSLRHSRFDGESWSPAVTLEQVPNTWAGFMTSLDAAIDSRGRIHLVWGGNWGPLHHRSVDLRFSLDPALWSADKVSDIRTFVKRIFVDDSGRLHLIHIPFFGVEPRGVFYQRSTDQGTTWSPAVNIHPDLPGTHTAQALEARFDSGGVFHAAWVDVDTRSNLPSAVRYARSTDFGGTWAKPVLFDESTAANPELIRHTTPVLAVNGSTVVLVWGGGGVINVGRRYRYSKDGGATWSPMEQLFGNLHGQAGTDALEFDRNGRLYFQSQIRWPMGIYLASWGSGVWTNPAIWYKIAEDDRDLIGARVHAQFMRLTINGDDQFATTFESCGAGCQDTSSLPNVSVLFATNTAGPRRELPPVAVVSAASFQAAAPLAPEAIAAGFGQRLAAATVTADGLPAFDLGGVSVEVIDSAGSPRPAPLFLAAPGQVNFIVPKGAASGPAKIRVRGESGFVAAGTFEIARVAPALFTANARGTGIVAGFAVRVGPDGAQTRTLLAGGANGAPSAVDLTAPGSVYLELFGTGFRGFTSGVTVSVDGQSVPVIAAVGHSQFPGLDQINIGPLPRIAGGREVAIRFVVDGREANSATFLVK